MVAYRATESHGGGPVALLSVYGAGRGMRRTITNTVWRCSKRKLREGKVETVTRLPLTRRRSPRQTPTGGVSTLRLPRSVARDSILRRAGPVLAAGISSMLVSTTIGGVVGQKSPNSTRSSLPSCEAERLPCRIRR